MLNSITPFFIVDDLAKTIEFYQSRLAFQVLYKGGDENGDFWAMLGRDQIMLRPSEAAGPECRSPARRLPG